MKMVVFDIDGTLLLAGGIGRIAFNRVFQEMFGFENIWQNYDPHGKTDSIIITDLAESRLGKQLNDLEKAEIKNRYIRYFDEMFDQTENFRLLPGVVKLLGVLQKQKLHLGIATGNYQETAARKLKRGAIDHYFSFGGYGSDSHNRVELTAKSLERGFQIINRKIDPSSIFLVGDAQADIESAKALGVRSIGVATGSLSVEKLQAFNPDYLLPNLEDENRFLSFILNG